MKITDLYIILRQIVIEWDTNPINRLNTFFVATAEDDYLATDLQKTYEDYQNGFFWSRSYQHSGSPRAGIKKEDVSLAAFHNLQQLSSLHTNVSQQNMAISIQKLTAPINQPKLSTVQAGIVAERMVRGVLSEMYTYRVYTLNSEFEGLPPNDYWFSAGKAKYMKDHGADLLETYETLASYIATQEVRIFMESKLSNQEIVTWTAEFYLNGCEEEPLSFNYLTQPTLIGQGLVSCPVC